MLLAQLPNERGHLVQVVTRHRWEEAAMAARSTSDKVKVTFNEIFEIWSKACQ